MAARIPLDVRFWRRVNKGTPNDCWEWTGRRNPKGYGQIDVDGRTETTHRVSWQLHNGPIPAGLFVCHHCDNPPCVNPAHLWLGTNADNQRDSIKKGRFHFHVPPPNLGESAHNHKLTDDQVRDIRRRFGPENMKELAVAFGVSPPTIKEIIHRRKWRHLLTTVELAQSTVDVNVVAAPIPPWRNTCVQCGTAFEQSRSCYTRVRILTCSKLCRSRYHNALKRMRRDAEFAAQQEEARRRA